MISCWARIGKCLMGQVFPNKNDSIPIFKIRKLKQEKGKSNQFGIRSFYILKLSEK